MEGIYVYFPYSTRNQFSATHPGGFFCVLHPKFQFAESRSAAAAITSAGLTAFMHALEP